MTEKEAGRIALSTRLRLLREQSGLSQGQVALKLGLHRPAVTEIEAGRRRVAAEELIQFADLYGVDVSWLAKGSPENENPVIELAARELAKLKEEDLNTILRLLATLRKEGTTR